MAGSISLNEILGIAEQESARHHHYYIGVEHLFIALTKLDHGLSNAVLEYCNLEPRFLRYSIRELIGVDEDRRYWPGFKETPRTQKVLQLARRYAGIHNPSERDLFLAILDEGDSIPVRVLQEVGAELGQLRVTAANWSGRSRAQMPKVPIQSSITLNPDEQAVLQRLFRTNEKIVVERELGGSYRGARILVVQPYRSGRAEVRVVVKIDDQAAILHEKHHYDSYVKDTLPPTTARIIDNPALPEDCRLGGLKYTFVQPTGSTDPTDLKNYAQQLSGIELSNIIHTGIFNAYGEAWWLQRQRYRFGVWREYEHVLPAAVEVYLIADAKPSSASRTLVPLEAWSRRPTFNAGELVELRGFTVQKVRNNSIQLTAGGGSEAVNRSSKVEVSGVDNAKERYAPGDVIESLIGRVTRTRESILRQQADLLQPNFDLRAAFIPALEPLLQVPNPLHHVDRFLDRRLSGYLSMIHGDLHLGNVLVGPAGDAWLIDFGLTREGHTLFDWAVLEVSLLSSVVGPRMPNGWEGVWGTIRLLDAINRHELRGYLYDNPVGEAFEAIKTLRHIVQENLARPSEWVEYHIALALIALRGLSWIETTSIDVRRLLFLTAALSVLAVNRAESSRLTASELTRESATTKDIINKPDPELSKPPEVAPSRKLPHTGLLNPAVLPIGIERDQTPIEYEDVQFALYHPSEVATQRWYDMRVYVHLESALEDVRLDVEQPTSELSTNPENAPLRKSSKLVRGTQLRLVPLAEGLEFEPASTELIWLKDYHRVDFRFQASPEMMRRPCFGEISVFVGPLEIATIRFSVFITDHHPSLDHAPNNTWVKGRMYERIFPAYAPDDITIEDACLSAFKAIGAETRMSRQHPDWDQTFRHLVDEADIFQLFWSDNAADSPEVQAEWQYALQRSSDEGFIRPVYWQATAPPVPNELEHLIFKYLPGLAD